MGGVDRIILFHSAFSFIPSFLSDFNKLSFWDLFVILDLEYILNFGIWILDFGFWISNRFNINRIKSTKNSLPNIYIYLHFLRSHIKDWLVGLWQSY